MDKKVDVEKVEVKKPTIWESLKAVSIEMPVIGRNQTAKIGEKFSYKYANIEKIWEIAKPIIEKNGFIITHLGNGTGLRTVAYHEPSGEIVESSINITQLDPQKKGAEITYYKRYNLCAIFNILIADEDKDAVGTGADEYDKERLAGIEEEAMLMNDLTELTSYYKQLGSPRDKGVLAIFANRKKQLTK